jgi:hypothetical protein
MLGLDGGDLGSENPRLTSKFEKKNILFLLSDKNKYKFCNIRNSTGQKGALLITT